jgi:hypothetical protein
LNEADSQDSAVNGEIDACHECRVIRSKEERGTREHMRLMMSCAEICRAAATVMLNQSSST